MTALHLALIYAVAGLAAAALILRHAGGWWSAAVAVPLWPLWLPFALRLDAPGAPSTPAASRVEAALREGLNACRGTPLAHLLPVDTAQQLVDEVSRVEARCEELGRLLTRPDLNGAHASARLAELERQGASDRAIATARLHRVHVERLHHIHQRDRDALTALADLAEALRTQLVLARYEGASVEGVGDLIGELSARVEGLSSALSEVGSNRSLGEVESEGGPML